jgi:anti-anti-sigma factor
VGEVVIVGAYDFENSGALRRQLNEAVMLNAGQDLVLDLSGVTFLDSVGLGALISAYKRSRRNGGDLIIAKRSPQVHEILELSGLLHVFTTRQPLAGDSAARSLDWPR